MLACFARPFIDGDDLIWSWRLWESVLAVAGAMHSCATYAALVQQITENVRMHELRRAELLKQLIALCIENPGKVANETPILMFSQKAGIRGICTLFFLIPLKHMTVA